MIKFVQAFLTGLFFTFILDFNLFLGIKLHYIDHHGIDVYYNTLFADNQNGLLFFALVAVLGWITMYWKWRKTAWGVMFVLFTGSFALMIPGVGLKAGELMFRKPNVQISLPPHVYRGDIVYTDRNQLYFYDTDLQRQIKLPKEK